MSSLNSKKEKDKNTNNGLQQNTTLKTKDYETRTHLKTEVHVASDALKY
jgi:hypothetical protein